jgi:hypothetical protein
MSMAARSPRADRLARVVKVSRSRRSSASRAMDQVLVAFPPSGSRPEKREGADRRAISAPPVARQRSAPNQKALENAMRILDGGHMAVVVFNHLDRGAHLLGEEIHVDTLGEPEGGVGVPEAIGAAAALVRTGSLERTRLLNPNSLAGAPRVDCCFGPSTMFRPTTRPS